MHAEHALKCLKVEYLGRIEYDFQKSRVTGPWDHKDSVSAKKVKKKISSLCTFKTTRNEKNFELGQKNILIFSFMNPLYTNFSEIRSINCARDGLMC